MKILSYLLSACLISFSFVGFTGCSDDDPKDPNQSSTNGSNDPNDPNTPGTPSENQPVVSNPVTGLRTQNNTKWKFYYSNGKMTGGTDDDGYTFKFTSTPFTITENYKEEDGYDKIIYSNIQLNKYGYVTQANYLNEGSETYGGETETWKYTGTISISYNNDEYISKVIMNAKYEEDGEYCGTERNEISFTWNEGNLITVDSKYHSEDIEEGIDDGRDVTTFNYSSGQPNSGIYLSDFADFAEPYFWYAGLLGKPSRLVPVHVSIEDIEDNGNYQYSESYTITANYNGDATVSGLTLHHEQYNYDSNIQFFYGGAYPNFDDKAQYQLNQAVKKSFARKHSARRK